MLLSDFGGKGIKPDFQETLKVTGERMAKHGISTCCSPPFLSCFLAFTSSMMWTAAAEDFRQCGSVFLLLVLFFFWCIWPVQVARMNPGSHQISLTATKWCCLLTKRQTVAWGTCSCRVDLHCPVLQSDSREQFVSVAVTSSTLVRRSKLCQCLKCLWWSGWKFSLWSLNELQWITFLKMTLPQFPPFCFGMSRVCGESMIQQALLWKPHLLHGIQVVPAPLHFMWGQLAHVHGN